MPAVEFEWVEVASDGGEITGDASGRRHVGAYAVLALLTAACVALLVLLSGPTAPADGDEEATPTSVH